MVESALIVIITLVVAGILISALIKGVSWRLLEKISFWIASLVKDILNIIIEILKLPLEFVKDIFKK